MSPVALVILLFIAGAILLFAELILPTHGVLGVLGLVVVLAGVVQCFMIDKWLGFGVFMGLLVASPFLGTWLINLYPKTAIGRRMILQDEPTVVRPPPVHIGQLGVALTELRPSGEVEFDAQRLEVISEYGIIEAGTRVKVVAIANNRAVVRTA
jgi:membrane-bound serine protease (ClpP class)